MAYANREHVLRRVILLYDNDERLAVPAAELCAEKGVDNVFILTGGLLDFGGHFPELLDGVPPPSLAAAFARAGDPFKQSRASVATMVANRRDSLGPARTRAGASRRVGVRPSQTGEQPRWRG